MPASMAMMAMTTNSSISVNPCFFGFFIKKICNLTINSYSRAEFNFLQVFLTEKNAPN
jgi:hypothetical protein